MTDGSGRYTVVGLGPGSYYLVANTLLAVGQLYSGTSCPLGSCSVTTGTPVPVASGQATTGIDFALVGAASIDGVVKVASNSVRLA